MTCRAKVAAMRSARVWLVGAMLLAMAGLTRAADEKPAPAKPATAPAKPAETKPAETKPAAPAPKAEPKPATPAPAKAPATTPAPAPAKTEPKPATTPAPATPKPEPKPATPPAAEKKPEPAPAKAPATTPAPVSFRNQIAPLFVEKCVACHGASDPKGQYSLQTFAMLMKEGASTAPPVAAGNLDDSELFRLITSDDAGERMPKEGDPLAPEQIELVRRWILEGAKFDGPDPKALLASLVPRKAHPNPPEAYRFALPIAALTWRPDGQELAVGGYHEVTFWNPATGALARRVKNVDQRTYGLAYSPDGKLLAVAAGTPGVSGEALLVDPAGGKLVRHLGSTSDVMLAVAFSPDGKRVAAAAADRSVRVYDVASGREELLIEDHADWILAVAWSPDGKQLATGSRDKTAKVFDAADGHIVSTYPGHSETVLAVAWSPDGKQVYSGGADRKVHAWTAADGKAAFQLTGYGGEVTDLVVDGDRVLACGADKTARLHTAGDKKQVRAFSGHADVLYALCYLPAKKQLATAGFDGEVRVWDVESGKQLAAFKASPGLAKPPAPAATAAK